MYRTEKQNSIIKRLSAFIICAALMFSAASAEGAACIRTYAAESDGHLYFSVGKSYESAVRYVAKCLEECPSEVDLTRFTLTPDDLVHVVDDVLLSRPDIFYVSTDFTYYTVGSGSKKKVIKLIPQYIYSLPSVPRKRQELEKAANEIVSGMEKNLPDEVKALYLHDALALKMEYDGDNEIRSAYEGLIKEKALCVAYALAYKYLADKAGLTCVCAISTEIAHCWNQVKINGKWYNVDVTFDDPIPDFYGQVTHDFFLVSDSTAGDGYDRTDLGYSAADKAFEGREWRKSDSRVIISGGKCIYADPVTFGIYSYDYKTDRSEKIISVSDSWKGHRGYCFTRLETDGERIYYNTETEIYSFSPKNPRGIKTEYTASLSGGDGIYGMKIKEGALYCQSADDPKKGPDDSFRAFSVSSAKNTESEAYGLSAPMNIKGKTAKNGAKYTVTLSWKAVDNADGYLVYRYDKVTKTKKKIADVKGTSYTVKDLTKGEYSFVICAYKKTGGKTVTGELSAPVTKKI